MPSIASIARDLLDAYDNGTLIPPPSSHNVNFDWASAYRVAAEMAALRRQRGERTVGRKIGFTNRNIWPEYGATSPIWAYVYDTTLVYARDNHAVLSLRGSCAPRLEPEIAFKLRAPVPSGCTDPEIILRSIEWLAPSFEVVDCHFVDWRFKAPDSAADQSFHWRLLIGSPYVIDAADLRDMPKRLADCTVTLKRDGEIRDRGVGKNALDHPALALAFLADILASQPAFDALGVGEVVTTGTLTAALPVHIGETWTSEISGLPVWPLTIAFSS